MINLTIYLQTKPLHYFEFPGLGHLYTRFLNSSTLKELAIIPESDSKSLSIPSSSDTCRDWNIFTSSLAVLNSMIWLQKTTHNYFNYINRPNSSKFDLIQVIWLLSITDSHFRITYKSVISLSQKTFAAFQVNDFMMWLTFN